MYLRCMSDMTRLSNLLPAAPTHLSRTWQLSLQCIVATCAPPGWRTALQDTPHIPTPAKCCLGWRQSRSGRSRPIHHRSRRCRRSPNRADSNRHCSTALLACVKADTLPPAVARSRTSTRRPCTVAARCTPRPCAILGLARCAWDNRRTKHPQHCHPGPVQTCMCNDGSSIFEHIKASMRI